MNAITYKALFLLLRCKVSHFYTNRLSRMFRVVYNSYYNAFLDKKTIKEAADTSSWCPKEGYATVHLSFRYDAKWDQPDRKDRHDARPHA